MWAILDSGLLAGLLAKMLAVLLAHQCFLSDFFARH
jgi:hypothetical protein